MKLNLVGVLTVELDDVDVEAAGIQAGVKGPVVPAQALIDFVKKEIRSKWQQFTLLAGGKEPVVFKCKQEGAVWVLSFQIG